VLRFVDIKHGDEKDDGLFTAKEAVISNGIYKNIEELISAINTGAKTSNHIFISRNETRQAKKSVYGLAVKMTEIAKRLIINFSNNFR